MQILQASGPDAINKVIVSFTQTELINGGGTLPLTFFNQFTNHSILLHNCFLVNNNAGALSNIYFSNATGQISDAIVTLAANESAFLYNFSTSPGFNYSLQAGFFSGPLFLAYTHSGIVNNNKFTIVIYYSVISTLIY